MLLAATCIESKKQVETPEPGKGAPSSCDVPPAPSTGEV